MKTLMTDVLNCSVGLKMTSVLKQEESDSRQRFNISIMLPPRKPRLLTWAYHSGTAAASEGGHPELQSHRPKKEIRGNVIIIPIDIQK